MQPQPEQPIAQLLHDLDQTIQQAENELVLDHNSSFDQFIPNAWEMDEQQQALQELAQRQGETAEEHNARLIRLLTEQRNVNREQQEQLAQVRAQANAQQAQNNPPPAASPPQNQPPHDGQLLPELQRMRQDLNALGENVGRLNNSLNTNFTHGTGASALSLPSFRTFDQGTTDLRDITSCAQAMPFVFPTDLHDMRTVLIAWENLLPAGTKEDVPRTILKRAFHSWPHASLVRRKYPQVDTLSYRELREILVRACARDNFCVLTSPGQRSLKELYEAALETFKHEPTLDKIYGAFKHRLSPAHRSRLDMCVSVSQLHEQIMHLIHTEADRQLETILDADQPSRSGSTSQAAHQLITTQNLKDVLQEVLLSTPNAASVAAQPASTQNNDLLAQLVAAIDARSDGRRRQNNRPPPNNSQNNNQDCWYHQNHGETAKHCNGPSCRSYRSHVHSQRIRDDLFVNPNAQAAPRRGARAPNTPYNQPPQQTPPNYQQPQYTSNQYQPPQPVAAIQQPHIAQVPPANVWAPTPNATCTYTQNQNHTVPVGYSLIETNKLLDLAVPRVQQAAAQQQHQTQRYPVQMVDINELLRQIQTPQQQSIQYQPQQSSNQSNLPAPANQGNLSAPANSSNPPLGSSTQVNYPNF